MKFRDFLEEQKEVHHVMAFGRMSPPTTGHEVLVNKVKEVAKSVGGSHSVVLSHTQDKDKNPLSSENKLKHAKRFFPKTNLSTSSKDSPTFLSHAAELHKKGVTHLHMVAGSDRVEEYKKKLAQYNGSGEGKLFNFKKITVHSAGQRDPDAEGTAGMSASKMRGHASSGNFKEFKKGIPAHVPEHHAKEMFSDVRKGMQIKESINEEFESLLFEGVHDKAIFKAVFLAGGPGSGKDYVLDNTLAGHGLTEINSDKALEFLMDKEKLDKTMPDNEESQRNAVREKAKSMTELRQRLALQGRNGLIINGTGDDYDKIKRIKEKLEILGYETSMVTVNTRDEVSQQRNVERGQRGGRTVPEKIRKEKWDSVQKSRPKFAELFKDNYVEFDNSEDLKNASPDVVKSKKDELLSLYKNFQKFVSTPPKNDKSKEWVASQLGNKDTLPTKSVAPETMHPSNKDSKATQEAKQLGLTYFGFGRWGKGGVITHHVVHGSLVANEVEKRAQTVVQVPQTKTIDKANEEFESFLSDPEEELISEEKKVKLLRGKDGKAKVFLLRRSAAKETHIRGGEVMKHPKGYVIKIKEENDNVEINQELFKQTKTSDSSGYTTNTRVTEGRTTESGGSYFGETSSRKKITIAEIYAKKKDKVINEIDAGIEPGLSMASSGENISRGLDRSMVTSRVKYNRDPKKKTIKELTGDETTMSIGDQKELELKRKGINLSSFKAKKFI